MSSRYSINLLLPFPRFLLTCRNYFLFYDGFVCMSVCFHGSIYMQHMYAWCQQKPEKPIESPETGVTDDCDPLQGGIQDLCKSISPPLQPCIFFKLANFYLTIHLNICLQKPICLCEFFILSDFRFLSTTYFRKYF